jgi:uncharacterized membrane protein
MKTTYDRLAGQSIERLAALSDGIFGVAMTLLLLEVHIPPASEVHGEIELLHRVVDLAPEVLVYLMSFITLGIFWVGQQTQLNHLSRSDRQLTWIHLGFLFGVTLVPLTTRLLVEFITYRTAVIAYILLLGVFLYTSWGRATRTKLINDDLPVEAQAAICHRIIIAQTLYAFAATLCFFSTYVSIALIVMIQLNYVLTPTQWLRRKKS